MSRLLLQDLASVFVGTLRLAVRTAEVKIDRCASERLAPFQRYDPPEASTSETKLSQDESIPRGDTMTAMKSVPVCQGTSTPFSLSENPPVTRQLATTRGDEALPPPSPFAVASLLMGLPPAPSISPSSAPMSSPHPGWATDAPLLAPRLAHVQATPMPLPADVQTYGPNRSHATPASSSPTSPAVRSGTRSLVFSGHDFGTLLLTSPLK